jgi:hypothetical protein
MRRIWGHLGAMSRLIEGVATKLRMEDRRLRMDPNPEL